MENTENNILKDWPNNCPNNSMELWRKSPLRNFSFSEIFLTPVQKKNTISISERKEEQAIKKVLQDSTQFERIWKKFLDIFLSNSSGEFNDEISLPNPESLTILFSFQSVLIALKAELSDNGSYILTQKIDRENISELEKFGIYISQNSANDLDEIINEKKIAENNFSDEALYALNQAHNPNFLQVYVKNNYSSANQILFVHLISDAESCAAPKSVLIIETEQRTQFIELFISAQDFFADFIDMDKKLGNSHSDELIGIIPVTQIHCYKQSHLDYHSISLLSTNNVTVQYIRVFIEKNAQFNAGISQIGSRFHKLFISSILAGRASQSNVHGFALATENRYLDLTAEQIHFAPATESKLKFKSTVDNRAFFNFIGMLRIEESAPHSKAYQINKNILLSSKARAHTTPKLEILTDEVKCSHGATVGDVDQEAIFYLQSRGVPEDEAKRTIIKGFLQDIIDQATSEISRKIIKQSLMQKL